MQTLENARDLAGGRRADFPKQQAVIGADRLGEALFREAIAEREQAVRIAAQIGALQLQKAANQQSRPDQQHQRQRELPGHQRRAQTVRFPRRFLRAWRP